jgi:hypothetical protein
MSSRKVVARRNSLKKVSSKNFFLSNKYVSVAPFIDEVFLSKHLRKCKVYFD